MSEFKHLKYLDVRGNHIQTVGDELIELINKKNLHNFINKLDVSDDLKKELKKVSPHNYIGILKK